MFATGLLILLDRTMGFVLLFPSENDYYKNYHQQKKNQYFNELKPFISSLTSPGVFG